MMQAVQRMFNVPRQADDGVHKIQALDQLWKEADEYFWNAAHSIDRSNEKGRVAREYGLLDPNGARPTFLETFVEMAQSIAARPRSGGFPSGHDAHTEPDPAKDLHTFSYVDTVSVQRSIRTFLCQRDPTIDAQGEAQNQRCSDLRTHPDREARYRGTPA